MKENNKVLIYLHGAARGGVESLVQSLFEYFEEKKTYRLYVITPTELSKFVLDLPKDRLYKIVENRPSNIAEVIDRINPKILYVPRSSSETHLYFIEALRNVRFPVRYIAGEHIPPDLANVMFRSEYHRQMIFTAADAIHLLSENYKKSLPQWMQGKASVIENLVEVSVSEDERPFSIRPAKLISAGRLSYEKGFDVLIKSMVELSELFPELELDIYGDGPDRARLSRLISILGLEGVVHLKPTDPDWHNSFGINDIYICSSYYEGYGLSLAEAVKKGVPSLAFESSQGPKSIIKNNVNGILLPGGPCRYSLVKGVNQLLNNKELCNTLSGNAKRTFPENYNNTIIDKWDALFSSLLHKEVTELETIKDFEGKENPNKLIANYCHSKSFVPYSINLPLVRKPSVINKIVTSEIVSGGEVSLYRRYRRVRKVVLQWCGKL